MKKLAITLITIISLFSANISQGADRYVTVVKFNVIETTNIAVAANEVAWIDLFHVTGGSIDAGFLQYTMGAHTVDMANQILATSVPLAGPGTIKFNASTNRGMILTVKIQPNPNINGVGQ